MASQLYMGGLEDFRLIPDSMLRDCSLRSDDAIMQEQEDISYITLEIQRANYIPHLFEE